MLPTKLLLRSRGYTQRRANPRIAGLNEEKNKLDPFTVGEESAFHGVDGELLKVVEPQAKGFRRCRKLFGHGRVAHQAVIGVQTDAKLGLIKDLEGMFGKAGGGAGMDIASEADFEGNAFIENVLCQVAQFNGLAIR